ncbi:MAG: ribonuclease HII [Bacteroidota bacterium]
MSRLLLPLLPYAFPAPYAGCDEAGRGCLAGPVVAGAVVLPTVYELPYLKDSKKLSAQQRNRLAIAIKAQAVAWGVGEANVAEITRYNILQATFLAMHRAIDQVMTQCSIRYLMIDGNQFQPYRGLPYQCVVRGDDRIPAIAAAAILAKTTRDKIMETLAGQYPDYGWESNKGYGTPMHKAAIQQKGCTIHHRISFAPCKNIHQRYLFS